MAFPGGPIDSSGNRIGPTIGVAIPGGSGLGHGGGRIVAAGFGCWIGIYFPSTGRSVPPIVIGQVHNLDADIENLAWNKIKSRSGNGGDVLIISTIAEVCY